MIEKNLRASKAIIAAASAFGRMGGRVKSARKAAAVRANGKKGGRVPLRGWFLVEEDRALGALVLAHADYGRVIVCRGRTIAETFVYRVRAPWREVAARWRAIAEYSRATVPPGFSACAWKPRTIERILASAKNPLA